MPPRLGILGGGRIPAEFDLGFRTDKLEHFFLRKEVVPALNRLTDGQEKRVEIIHMGKQAGVAGDSSQGVRIVVVNLASEKLLPPDGFFGRCKVFRGAG
jgi:hypothetical protein